MFWLDVSNFISNLFETCLQIELFDYVFFFVQDNFFCNFASTHILNIFIQIKTNTSNNNNDNNNINPCT